MLRIFSFFVFLSFSLLATESASLRTMEEDRSQLMRFLETEKEYREALLGRRKVIKNLVDSFIYPSSAEVERVNLYQKEIPEEIELVEEYLLEYWSFLEHESKVRRPLETEVDDTFAELLKERSKVLGELYRQESSCFFKEITKYYMEVTSDLNFYVEKNLLLLEKEFSPEFFHRLPLRLFWSKIGSKTKLSRFVIKGI